MAQLLLKGLSPHLGAYTMKFPGTYLVYALSMLVFGQGIAGIRIGLLLVNCASTVVLFLLCRKIMKESSALAASASYALLSLSSSVFGFAAHATQFVVLPTLAGALCLLAARERKSLPLTALAGALFGLAVLCKQPGAFFFLFGCAFLVQGRLPLSSQALRNLLREFMALCAGCALPLATALLWIAASGGLGTFLFWSVTAAGKYVEPIPFGDAVSAFFANFPPIPDGYVLVWVLALVGLAVLARRGGTTTQRPFVLLFCLFSLLSVCPGFYFRAHYFVLLLPAVSMLAALSLEFLGETAARKLPGVPANLVAIGIMAIALAAGILWQRAYLFWDAPLTTSRKMYGPNPFPESLEIAKFIKARSAPGDSIAVFGSEPQIFFYANRRSATGYIYFYPLVGIPYRDEALQEQMIREVTAARPRFVVVVSVAASWLEFPAQDSRLYQWMQSFLRTQYRSVGVVDLISPDLTVTRWLKDADSYAVRSVDFILIYELVGEGAPPDA